MFERELIDGLFVQRWSIVRTLMPQSIAEHTYLVCHYANDIAVYLGLPAPVHLCILQYGLWHDQKDEIFTGDLPGPNKRGLLNAIGEDAKEAWDLKLSEWADRTFANLEARMGGRLPPRDAVTVKRVLKVADWMESATRMATETQMGNQNAFRHVNPNANGAREELKRLIEHLHMTTINTDEVPFTTETGGAYDRFMTLDRAIQQCVGNAAQGMSAGPWITREDDSRDYHDPCVDSLKAPK